MTEREKAVVRLANELVRRHACTLPVDVAALCPIYGARLVTLSELEKEGLDAEAVFAVWGNRDGVAMASRRGRTIGYNDRAAEKRICESGYSLDTASSMPTARSSSLEEKSAMALLTILAARASTSRSFEAACTGAAPSCG